MTCFSYKQNIHCLKHIRLSLDILGAPSWLFFEAKGIYSFLSLCVSFLTPSFFLPSPPLPSPPTSLSLSLSSFFPSFLLFLDLFASVKFTVQKLQRKEPYMDWTSRKIFCYALSTCPTIINDCIQEKYSFYSLVEIHFTVTISHRLRSGFQLEAYLPVDC